MVFVLLTFVGRTYADNLVVDQITIRKGGTMKVGIVLNNPTIQYVAFQIDLKLPDGISIANNEEGEPDCSLNEERINNHRLSVEYKGSGVYRLLAFSFPVNEFSGTDGDLVYVTLEADKEAIIGDLVGEIKSQVFTGSDNIEYKWEDISFVISVDSPLGDANSDGELSETDRDYIIRHIMGDTPDDFDEEAANLNGDENIDVADIVELNDLLKEQ